MMNVEQTVLETLETVAEDESLGAEEFRSDQKLVDDLGFRSLDMARIIAILDGKLGVDPFTNLVSITSIRTVGDLCQAYTECTSGGNGSANTQEDAQLEQSRRRAEARLSATRDRTG